MYLHGNPDLTVDKTSGVVGITFKGSVVDVPESFGPNGFLTFSTTQMFSNFGDVFECAKIESSLNSLETVTLDAAYFNFAACECSRGLVGRVGLAPRPTASIASPDDPEYGCSAPPAKIEVKKIVADVFEIRPVVRLQNGTVTEWKLRPNLDKFHKTAQCQGNSSNTCAVRAIELNLQEFVDNENASEVRVYKGSSTVPFLVFDSLKLAQNGASNASFMPTYVLDNTAKVTLYVCIDICTGMCMYVQR